MIALISAMEEEIGDLKRAMEIRKTASYQCCRIYEGKFGGKENLLVLTGVGGEHAQQVTQLILTTYPISAVISTGFGGSLNPKTDVGDVVIYAQLFCGDEAGRAANRESLKLDTHLAAPASPATVRNGFKTMIGNGVTVSKVCSTAQAKQALGNEFNADIVDMESYFIGRATLEKHCPFIAVRSIFDTMQDDLSALDNISSSGKIVPRRMFSYLIAHPGEAKSLVRYARNSRKARKSLAVYLAELVEKL